MTEIIADLMTLNVGDLFTLENVYNQQRKIMRVTHMDRENDRMSATPAAFEEVGLLDTPPPTYYWPEQRSITP